MKRQPKTQPCVSVCASAELPWQVEMHPPSSLKPAKRNPPRRHALQERAIPQFHHGDGFACGFPSMRNVVDVTDNKPESVGSCRW
jgi:hypothetical protein